MSRMALPRPALARRALRRMRPHRAQFAVAVAAAVAQSALSIAPVLVIQRLLEQLQRQDAAFGELAVLIAAGLAAAVAAGLFGVLQSVMALRVSTGVVADLRQEVGEHLLTQSVAYFTRTRAGDLMSRILNDVGAIDAAVGPVLLGLVRDALTALAMLVVMFVLDWRLATTTLVLFPAVALGLRLASRSIYRRRRAVQEQLASFTAHTQDVLSLSGMMLVKAFAGEPQERARLGELNDTLRRRQVSAGVATSWFTLGFGLLQLVGPALLLGFGAYLVVHDELTLAALLTFVAVAAMRFATALQRLAGGLIAVISSAPAWERVFELLDEESEVREAPDAVPLAPVRGRIVLRDVGFTYAGQSRPALDGVSLEVEPGSLVALVGPSGAGKTTLSGLVARFFDPQTGTVEIDGHDLRAVTLASVAASIGIVLQETYLFNGSLLENLRYGRPDATDAEVRAAAAAAHLDPVVAGLADGYGTFVGERGHRLSGGERQRVAIARAILKDPPILILDEATSHLDTVSERRVQAALDAALTGRTSLVIAHRLSTIRAADLVVVLDHGRIVERGTHDQLLLAGGLYARLYAAGFGRDEATAPV